MSEDAAASEPEIEDFLPPGALIQTDITVISYVDKDGFIGVQIGVEGVDNTVGQVVYLLERAKHAILTAALDEEYEGDGD